MRTVSTIYSVYQIDEAEHLIRRVSGANDPTPRQGTDGEWREYETIEPLMGGLWVMWDSESGKGTWTSDVVSDVSV